VKQIIKESNSDVLLMRPGSETSTQGFSRVLACIDFSEYDIPIIKAADQLCLADEGSLEVFHVFYPPWKKDDHPENDPLLASSDFESEYKAVLQGRLDSLVPMNIHGVPSFKSTTTVVEHLEHCEGILGYLKSTGADVAVVGARGQGKIETMILGRIAERIVTESPCSVYIVKNLCSSEDEDQS
jgi:nucleotide-binding universal stress UspA family protein